MGNKELKEALLSKKPVIHNSGLLGDIEYARISAIIYREKDGEIVISAELEDKNGKAVTIARANDVR